MTREEAKGYLMNISYQLGTMSVIYLSEKDGEKMREAINALQEDPCEDCISRADAIEFFKDDDYVVNELKNLAPVTPAKNVDVDQPNVYTEDEVIAMLIELQQKIENNVLADDPNTLSPFLKARETCVAVIQQKINEVKDE